MPAGAGGGRIQPATSSVFAPTADSMPAMPDQVTYSEVNARREAQRYFSFIHRVDASHHNNLFYRPYGMSYEIGALARSSGR